MEGRILNNRYKLEEKIGEGGMAVVFRAEDQLLGRKVAVKILRPQFASDVDFVRRFQREAKAAASLNHPHIVNVYDIGQDGEFHYLVMENVEGIDLKKKLKNEGKLSIEESLEIVSQIGEALALAHRNNIVHCDIKPHNILLTEDNGCKVTDFGIARAVSSATLTHTDSVVGSAPYISPEQAKGDRLTSSSDIYSLGVVLYELLTGRLPFQGDGPITLALKHIRERPSPPSLYVSNLPQYIEKIVMKSLEKEPEDRYPNAESLLDEIETAREIYLQNKSGKAKSDLKHDEDDTQELPHIKDFVNHHRDLDLEDDYWDDDGEEELEERKNRWKAIFSLFSRRKVKSEEKQMLENQEVEKSGEEKIHGSKYKKYRYLVYSLLLIILVLTVGWGIFSWYMDVPVVEVPDLVGLSEEEVEEKLKETQLRFIISGDQPHNEIPKGSVVTHFPQAGTNIRASREVRLILSSGPMWAEVPDLYGITLREAEIILSAAGLSFGEIEFEFDEDYEPNTIIRQTPEAGKEIVADELINLVVSQGSEDDMVRLPNLTGLTQSEAEDRLSELGLIVGDIDREESRRFRAGYVIAHNPSSGTPLVEGGLVDLVLSSGLVNEDQAQVYSPGIRVPVPEGPQEQEIRIEIEDLNGRYTLYEETHRPGDRVFQRAHTVGPTIVQVFINGELAKEEKIGH